MITLVTLSHAHKDMLKLTLFKNIYHVALIRWVLLYTNNHFSVIQGHAANFVDFAIKKRCHNHNDRKEVEKRQTI